MKAILTEKPSVARELAVLLGATQKNKGYYSSPDYRVTWAIGHLVGLAMPEDYGITAFDANSLPLLPKPFSLVPRKASSTIRNKADAGTLDQLKIIEEVFRSCSSIIVATDAGREGELIFRYIYSYLGCTKPFERLWISSLTESAIRKGFSSLRPGSDFDSLYQAARCRSEADWAVGINATQALTIAAGDGLYSLGRVQTPTLCMISERYLQHSEFKQESYWKIALTFRKDFTDFRSSSIGTWTTKTEAETAMAKIARNPVATITDISENDLSESPPLLFDLTGLQKEANAKLGFSATETLALAQKLYEKKFITYPRTGSRHIPEDQWQEIPHLIKSLATTAKYSSPTTQIKWGRLNRRIVDDNKVTDHHGLLITLNVPTALSKKEEAVYDLIVSRLLESVSPPCLMRKTKMTFTVSHIPFVVHHTHVLELGWRQIRADFDYEPVANEAFPNVSVEETVKIMDMRTVEAKTSSPKPYSEATLLAAMELAGDDLDNVSARKTLKGIGIGTPATRAAVIETLLQREYIKREKGLLVPTQKGLQVHQWVKHLKIADVSLTAEWENAFQEIENNNLSATKFKERLHPFVAQMTTELLQLQLPTETHPHIHCPRCHKELLRFSENTVECPNPNCKWKQFRKICGTTLTMDDIQQLVQKGKTPLLKGLKSKSGKSFDAFITLQEDGSTKFQFPTKTHS